MPNNLVNVAGKYKRSQTQLLDKCSFSHARIPLLFGMCLTVGFWPKEFVSTNALTPKDLPRSASVDTTAARFSKFQ